MTSVSTFLLYLTILNYTLDIGWVIFKNSVTFQGMYSYTLDIFVGADDDIILGEWESEGGRRKALQCY